MNKTRSNVIITERCILRKVRKDDAAPMFRNWASDPEVTRYLTWLPHQSVEVSQMIIDSWLKDEENPQTIRFVITIKGNDEPVGSIDVVKYVDGNPEIGYCISRKLWGKGLMTEICSAFVKHLFDMGFIKVFINAAVDNIGSNRVIEKCGFKFIGKERLEHTSVFKPEPMMINSYEMNK